VIAIDNGYDVFCYTRTDHMNRFENCFKRIKKKKKKVIT